MRHLLLITTLGVAAGISVGTAAGAAPVRGSISGPVTAVKGKTFTVKTTLSPTGSSKVSVRSTTRITEQASGSSADLKKGACVMATGTKQGAAIAATRITLSSAANGSCTGGRPAGGRPPGGTRPPGGRGGGGGFTPPANFAFAFGQITAVNGSTLTVKSAGAMTKVTVASKTAVSKTVVVGISAVKAKLCAFVSGTSADKGVTVQAQNVSLSNPVGGSCTGGFRRP